MMGRMLMSLRSIPRAFETKPAAMAIIVNVSAVLLLD